MHTCTSFELAAYMGVYIYCDSVGAAYLMEMVMSEQYGNQFELQQVLWHCEKAHQSTSVPSVDQDVIPWEPCKTSASTLSHVRHVDKVLTI